MSHLILVHEDFSKSFPLLIPNPLIKIGISSEIFFLYVRVGFESVVSICQVCQVTEATKTTPEENRVISLWHARGALNWLIDALGSWNINILTIVLAGSDGEGAVSSASMGEWMSKQAHSTLGFSELMCSGENDEYGHFQRLLKSQ